MRWTRSAGGQIVRAFAVLATVVSPQLPSYRPSNLGDLVDAVGSNRDGLDDLDLSPDVHDYAMFVGDALGIAARMPDDPDGAIVVLWRRRGEVWRYRSIDAVDLAAVRSADAAPRAGRIESVLELGTHVVVTTRAGAHESASIVLRADLAPTAFVSGTARVALPSGSLVLERTMPAGDVRVSLTEFNPATRETRALYVAPAQAARGVPAISSVQFDDRTDTLRFTLTFEKDPGQQHRVECRPMRLPSRTCVEAAARAAGVTAAR